jgi:hypothetical protein
MQAQEALIDHGLELLRSGGDPAHDYEIEENKPEPADLGLAFDGITRAARFTVAQHEGWRSVRISGTTSRSARSSPASAAPCVFIS